LFFFILPAKKSERDVKRIIKGQSFRNGSGRISLALTKRNIPFIEKRSPMKSLNEVRENPRKMYRNTNPASEIMAESTLRRTCSLLPIKPTIARIPENISNIPTASMAFRCFSLRFFILNLSCNVIEYTIMPCLANNKSPC